MKVKRLGETSSFLFGDRLVISFSPRWIELFNGIPKFEINIDKNGRLSLIGPTIKGSSIKARSGDVVCE